MLKHIINIIQANGILKIYLECYKVTVFINSCETCRDTSQINVESLTYYYLLLLLYVFLYLIDIK